MDGGGVNNGTKETKNDGDDFPSATTALPNELLLDICAKVASRSVVDICNLKESCNQFLHVGEKDHVYRDASLEKFAPVPWSIDDRESWFLKRCRESGNMESCYRDGMLEYFTSASVDSGLDKLRRAALEGHNEAKYVYCMILMCNEEDEVRKQGFDLFQVCTSITTCRQQVNSFRRSTWVKNPVV